VLIGSLITGYRSSLKKCQTVHYLIVNDHTSLSGMSKSYKFCAGMQSLAMPLVFLCTSWDLVTSFCRKSAIYLFLSMSIHSGWILHPVAAAHQESLLNVCWIDERGGGRARSRAPRLDETLTHWELEMSALRAGRNWDQERAEGLLNFMKHQSRNGQRHFYFWIVELKRQYMIGLVVISGRRTLAF